VMGGEFDPGLRAGRLVIAGVSWAGAEGLVAYELVSWARLSKIRGADC
jgi:hypothetical protein